MNFDIDIFMTIISNIINISLMPVIVFMFRKSFYDEELQLTRSNILRCLLPEIPAVTVMQLTIFTDLIPSALLVETITQLIYLIIPVVVFCGRSKPVRYYLKNMILTAVLSGFFNLIVTTFVISINMILMRSEIMTDYSDNLPYYLLSLFCLIVIILWLYIEFIRKQLTIPLRKRDTFLFFVYFLFVIMIFLTNSYNDEYGWNNSSGIAFISVKLIMLLLLILIPVIIIKNRQSIYFNELSIRNAQFLEIQLTASNAYRQSQEDTRAFRHDMHNNLLMISVMMQKKQYSQAEEYINNLSGKLSSFSPRIMTGDSMLDALLASKLPVIEEKSIKFDITGIIDGGLDWKPIDVCAVFANLMDNAIEACDQLSPPDRYIKIHIKKNNFQYILTFHNSVAQFVDCSKLHENSQYTSKSDKSCHGFGMKNIRHTLAKYGALMQIDCTDTEFTTQIMITKS